MSWGRSGAAAAAAASRSATTTPISRRCSMNLNHLVAAPVLRARATLLSSPPAARRSPLLAAAAATASASSSYPAAAQALQPFALQARRGIMGPAGPTDLLVESAGFPENSMSRQLLQRCVDEAVYRGTDLTQEYLPWFPVDVLQTLIINVHDATGSSWLTAIVVACVGIRIATLPVTIAATRGGREKALLQPEFARLSQKQTDAHSVGDAQKANDAQKEMQAFQAKHGKWFMLKGTWNTLCFQVPLYVTAFAAMRGLANHPHLFPGFAMESPLWLDSLALADPYCGLPLITGALMLTNMEISGSIDGDGAASATNTTGQGIFQSMDPDRGATAQKWVMRGAAAMFVPLTWNFPSGIFIFMCTNMFLASVQGRVLRMPVFERLLDIPPTLEKHEAANKAMADRPLALLNLGTTLPNASIGSKLGTIDAGRRAQPKLLAMSSSSSFQAPTSPAEEIHVGPVPLTSRTPKPVDLSGQGAKQEKSSLEKLAVSQKFSLNRAVHSESAR
mmetsp:Transcript_24203/g.51599  ORF Transcript_24203/g.51599 Transcript_24203/m.51599 type:complete len:505 (+) Transcript_24203:134-1648(+)